MDSHELLKALKNLAVELGRTPNRNEFLAQLKGGRHALEKYFRNYSVFLQAAGFETFNERRSKPLTNEIFESSIETRLEVYHPPISTQKKDHITTLVIGDTHFPFASERVLKAIYDWALKNKPKRIVQIGDLYDCYAWSRFPKSINIYTPKEEQDLGRRHAEAMWLELKRASPEADCIQLKGNHDIRPMKQTLAHLPALEQVVGRYLDEIMSFPGVTTITDERQEFIVDDIAFIHGYLSGNGRHRDYMKMNAVCGHTHLGGVTFRRCRGETLWELNAGLVGDPETKALSYTAQKIVNWTPGFGVIWPSGPQFIPV